MGNEYKEQIWNQLRVIQNKMRGYLHEFGKKCGMSLQEILLLREIAARPGITLVEISHTMGMSKSTTSSMVSRLEERGAIIREIPKYNRRIVLLRVSPDFSKRPEIIETRTELVSGLLKDISEEDAVIIMEGLERLDRLLDGSLEQGSKTNPEQKLQEKERDALTLTK